MNVYRYAPQALALDYLRGGGGAVLSAGLLALSPSVFLIALFAGLTALFLLFTLRTALRQRARLEVNDEGIALIPSRAGQLRWGEIDGVRLRYYSTRRSRDKGWMTMRIAAGRRRIELDSSLDGFDAVLARAARLVQTRNLPMDPATRANFQSAGHLLDLELRPQDVPLPFSGWAARRRGPLPDVKDPRS